MKALYSRFDNEWDVNLVYANVIFFKWVFVAIMVNNNGNLLYKVQLEQYNVLATPAHSSIISKGWFTVKVSLWWVLITYKLIGYICPGQTQNQTIYIFIYI